jgi:hypothetical protein
MANTSAFRFVGPTTAITVTSTSSTAVTITPAGNDQVNWCAFLNTSANPVAITIAPVYEGVGTIAAAAVLPTGGNTSQSFILGVSMSQPTVISVPQVFTITAIGTSGTTLYVMPVVDQN